jgi:hypothetical protein
MLRLLENSLKDGIGFKDSCLKLQWVCQFQRVLMKVYYSRRYWVPGLGPSSSIPNRTQIFWKLDVSGLG